MVDFRRIIPALTVVALLLGSAVTASAQGVTPFQCFANGGVSTSARVEGLTELLGDLVLNCTGGIPTAPGVAIVAVNIQVFLNTSLTSRLLTAAACPGSPGCYSEALLLLDEPLPGAQFTCNPGSGSTVCTGYGNGFGAASTVAYYGGGITGSPVAGCTFAGTCPGNNKNIFQGIQLTSNSVVFLGVPIDPPGTSGARVIRITNIRGNANALGVAGRNATPTPVVETISATPPQFLPLANPTQTVGFIQRGLTFGTFTSSSSVIAAGSTTLHQCDNSRSSSGSTNFNTPIGVLRYSENFATAFMKRFTTDSTARPSGGPGAAGAAPQQNNLPFSPGFTPYNTESGFVNNGLSLPSGPQSSSTSTAGLADWGTRVKAVFNDVPAGISLFVDTDGVWTGSLGATTATCNNITGVYTSCLDHFSLTASETGAYSAVGSNGGSPNDGHTTQLSVISGTATAIWEDLDSDPNTFASVNFGIYVTYTASPITNSPALATSIVNGIYAPTSTVVTASNASVPRFADTSTATNLFSIVPCFRSNPAIFRSGFFWLEDVDGNRQFNSPPDRAFAFGGIPGDIAIAGDWNGDYRSKVGIYRASNGLFILDYDGDGQFTVADKVYDLGVGAQAGDVPVVGDWNGDGRTKVGLFRQGFFWILDTNGNGVFEQGIDQTFAFGGVSGDLPVVGDWSGDGRSKLGIFRSGFFWILDYNGNGTIDNVNLAGGDKAFPFGGIPGDVPVVGDWNLDGRSKVGVFRAGFFWVLDANGNYQFDGTGPGQDLAFAFGGIAGDKPVLGKW